MHFVLPNLADPHNLCPIVLHINPELVWSKWYQALDDFRGVRLGDTALPAFALSEDRYRSSMVQVVVVMKPHPNG